MSEIYESVQGMDVNSMDTPREDFNVLSYQKHVGKNFLQNKIKLICR